MQKNGEETQPPAMGSFSFSSLVTAQTPATLMPPSENQQCPLIPLTVAAKFFAGWDGFFLLKGNLPLSHESHDPTGRASWEGLNQ